MKVYNYCQSDNLKACVLCYPVNFKIIKKSNEYYNNIDYDLVYRQYNKFINTLSKNDVKLYFIDINKNATQQVFTQDIGFVIDDLMFVSKMKQKEREIETESFISFVKDNNIKYYEMKNNIEGGDVIKYQDVVFVGISSRTTIEAAKELQEALISMGNNSKVIPINFDAKKIHLDCVFNTLDKDSAVICDYVYDRKIIEEHIKNLYEISKKDADDLGTNYVYLGNRKLISSNKVVSELLREKGYEVEYVDYSEIIKDKGSLGCSAMFIERG